MRFALDDTIAAIVTPPGEAGLAVLRLSGPRALAIADDVFRGRAPLAEAAGHTLHHGWLGGEDTIDEVVAAVFRAPASYTREDVVELSCHGGRMPAARALERLLASGARLARPGEFTLRAFLHGRLDLVQAEAVAELIHARSDVAHRAALARLAGELSRELREQLDQLADLVAEVEARVDFAEDVGGIEVPAEVIARIAALRQALDARLAGAAWGRALREGVQVAIVGRPNAGKSSLFNRLVGEDRAIVTAAPGTTRDRVSATIEVRGAPFTLSDTAGLREPGDAIEAEGVTRARRALAESRVALWVVDASAPEGAGGAWIETAAPAASAARAAAATLAPPAESADIARALAGQRVVLALNKCDLGVRPEAEALAGALEHAVAVRVSARTGEGVEALVEALARVAGFEPGDVLSTERQAEALASACASLARAAEQGAAGAPGEIVAIELREAMATLEELLGVRVGDDLLERIFSRFCVGK
jgi:tRNA modification GTPase